MKPQPPPARGENQRGHHIVGASSREQRDESPKLNGRSWTGGGGDKNPRHHGRTAIEKAAARPVQSQGCPSHVVSSLLSARLRDFRRHSADDVGRKP